MLVLFTEYFAAWVFIHFVGIQKFTVTVFINTVEISRIRNDVTPEYHKVLISSHIMNLMYLKILICNVPLNMGSNTGQVARRAPDQ